MKNNLRNKKKKGFTLIELIIVIAIIAILAAIAIPRFGSATQDAKLKSDIANAKTIANATSALMAEGKIEDDADPITVVAEADADADSDAEDLAKYLQSVPTPETEGNNFIVNIENGNVTVTTDAEGATLFFPYTE